MLILRLARHPHSPSRCYDATAAALICSNPAVCGERFGSNSAVSSSHSLGSSASATQQFSSSNELAATRLCATQRLATCACNNAATALALHLSSAIHLYHRQRIIRSSATTIAICERFAMLACSSATNASVSLPSLRSIPQSSLRHPDFQSPARPDSSLVKTHHATRLSFLCKEE